MTMDQETFRNLPQPVALVVDDEPLILMDSADIISDEGYHVIEARSADEAFAFLENHNSLRLLLTDVQMPGAMDGIALACSVARMWPHIQIIVASGAVQPAQGALPDGVTFMNKPISIQLVHEALQDFKH
jgi:CheY-like chemotaxis protein